jgi:hypothetical protein
MIAAPPHPRGSGTYHWEIPYPPTTASVSSWTFVVDASKWAGDANLVPWEVFNFAKNGGQGEYVSGDGRHWYVIRGTHPGSLDLLYTYGSIYIYRADALVGTGRSAMDETLGGCPMGVECAHSVTDELHGGTTGAPAGNLQRGGAVAPISHGGEHWIEIPSHQVPYGVLQMFGSGSNWQTYRADQRWWAKRAGRCYVWLVDGPSPAGGLHDLARGMGRPGFGANPDCCSTTTDGPSYWIAGAIFALALATTGVAVVLHDKKKKH